MPPNLEPAELNKFDEMASHWWDPNGDCRLLHAINPIRLQFINDRCDLNQKTVIDIGCGGGILSESLAKREALVTGIDANVAVLEVAKFHAIAQNLSNLHYDHATAEEYATLHTGTFDIVTCMELLEHVPDPGSLIHACTKLVKPNGHLFFSTLNRTLKAYALAIVGAEYCLNLLPRATHQYEKFIRPAELDTWLKKTGLELQELAGIHYNPLTRTAKLSTDVSVNYIAYATFI
jgi:2-polyprenyl-6-hydroxyphenyl methylase/3-demethylubiquinone-9 3-methyltransferase